MKSSILTDSPVKKQLKFERKIHLKKGKHQKLSDKIVQKNLDPISTGKVFGPLPSNVKCIRFFFMLLCIELIIKNT